MDYATTKVRAGLYMVRWIEPDSGDRVTDIEDYYAEGACMASSAIGRECHPSALGPKSRGPKPH